MTVVIGVVTVSPVGVVTVAEVIGVVTVTVAATVAGNVGIETFGNETAGVERLEAECAGAPTSALAGGAALAVEPEAVSGRRRAG